MVMEHIYFSMTRINSAEKLLSVHKIKLTNIGQAIAIASFEIETPKFLQGTLAVVINDMVEDDQS